MKYIQKNRIPSSLLGGLLVLIVLLSVSQVWARDPVPSVILHAVNAPYNQAVVLPNGYSFLLSTTDEDGMDGIPLKYRYLVKEAVVGDVLINNRYGFDQHRDELITMDDPLWSQWIDFRLGDEWMPSITMPLLDEETYYIIAAQVLDADGAVSMERTYNESVVNFRVTSSMFRPEILMHEQFMGTFNSNVQTDIAATMPLNFWLEADAGGYGGSISSFRYGWDIADPDDPNDPGWAIDGVAEELIQVPEQVFTQGMHSLVCRAVDSYGGVRTLTWFLNVIPFVSPENQLPLLFIDQVIDSNSNRWPSSDGSVAFDRAEHRDEYWHFLDGAGGVNDFVWERDHIGEYQSVDYADIVQYKTVLVTARSHSNQSMFQEFRPQNGQDKYVWLAPYQAQGGNLFLVGDRSMESFLEVQNYMVPLMFDNNEQYYVLEDMNYIIGFGTHVYPDGSSINHGAIMYPYLTAGLSVLDWSVPLGKNIYDRRLPASEDRTSSCSGLKAMVLSDDFRTHHQVGGAVLSDTLYTNADIDWRDGDGGNLDEEFPFTGDEFIDANITSRPTYWEAQECAEGVDGLCLEPMFTGVSRFDWMRENRWSAGDTEWPGSEFSSNELDGICGEMALTTYDGPGGAVPNGTALVNGQTYGYLSYKNVADKPSGKADVYWGFDPYRFNAEESQKSVRWVLEYFGLALNR